jgi:glycosyltransferase involved in cell wall biosynthesis
MDIICFSHLRWNFVYQRPQHLLGRLSDHFRIFFYEEPIWVDATSKGYFKSEITNENIYVITPHLPNGISQEQVIQIQRGLVNQIVHDFSIQEFIAWFYSPMMIDILPEPQADLVVYDCMDELSAFKNAPAALILKEAELFKIADIVFTGGKSLFEAKRDRHNNVHLFPSSIDKQHFKQARTAIEAPADQKNIPCPRVGFFGVIDERMDTHLLDKIAQLRPDWSFVIIGPIVKIDPAILPQRSNIFYLGSKSYDELPEYLGGWEVAMMPFALNESTRFISPTKTPEFLAAGRPVVSTSIADVVSTYANEGLVLIADNAHDFVTAIEQARLLARQERWQQIADKVLDKGSWDVTVDKMLFLINTELERKQMKNIKTGEYV